MDLFGRNIDRQWRPNRCLRVSSNFPGVKNAKHVYIFFQQARKNQALTQNPYIFDTFDLVGDNSAKLDTCRLQYGSTFYPEVDYDIEDQTRIRRDLINYRSGKMITTPGPS